MGRRPNTPKEEVHLALLQEKLENQEAKLTAATQRVNELEEEMDRVTRARDRLLSEKEDLDKVKTMVVTMPPRMVPQVELDGLWSPNDYRRLVRPIQEAVRRQIAAVNRAKDRGRANEAVEFKGNPEDEEELELIETENETEK